MSTAANKIYCSVGLIFSHVVSGCQKSASASKNLYISSRPQIQEAMRFVQECSRKLRRLWRDDTDLCLVYGAMCALFTVFVFILPDVPYWNSSQLRQNLVIFLLTFVWIPTYCICTGLVKRLIVSIVKTNCAHTSQQVKTPRDDNRFFGVTASFWCFFGVTRLFFVVMFYAFFEIYKYRGCCFLFMFLFLYSELFVWHSALVCVREVRKKQSYVFGLSQDMESEYDTLVRALRPSGCTLDSSRYEEETMGDEEVQTLLSTNGCVTNHF